MIAHITLSISRVAVEATLALGNFLTNEIDTITMHQVTRFSLRFNPIRASVHYETRFVRVGHGTTQEVAPKESIPCGWNVGDGQHLQHTTGRCSFSPLLTLALRCTRARILLRTKRRRLPPEQGGPPLAEEGVRAHTVSSTDRAHLCELNACVGRRGAVQGQGAGDGVGVDGREEVEQVVEEHVWDQSHPESRCGCPGGHRRSSGAAPIYFCRTCKDHRESLINVQEEIRKRESHTVNIPAGQVSSGIIVTIQEFANR